MCLIRSAGAARRIGTALPSGPGVRDFEAHVHRFRATTVRTANGDPVRELKEDLQADLRPFVSDTESDANPGGSGW